MRPEELLNYLGGVAGVETVGEEEIDGEPVTHYAGEIDVDNLRSQSESRGAGSVRDVRYGLRAGARLGR